MTKWGVGSLGAGIALLAGLSGCGDSDAREIDAVKLRSSLTLFEAVSGDPLFATALADFFAEPDPETLRLLKQA